MSENTEKKLIRTRVGHVVSNKMDKTVVVKITSKKQDPDYKKYIKTSRKFFAHDQKNECQIGDQVRISACRPLSKNKFWEVSAVLNKNLQSNQE